MVKKRIIPVQLLIDGRLVKTVQFDSYRDVGNPITSSKVYSNQDADELVFLNINRDNRSVRPLIALIEKVSEVCFMPLAMGGGINRLEDAELLIKNGADKVVVNSICYNNLPLIFQIADKFGAQAVVVSIDVRYDQTTDDFRLYSDCGRKLQPICLEEHVKSVIKYGAGEIFINSIDNDGMMQGYDIRLIKRVMSVSTIPIIACGGAGNYTHMAEAFTETDVSACACGSLFNFGDNNPIRAKAFLSNYGLNFKVI